MQPISFSALTGGGISAYIYDRLVVVYTDYLQKVVLYILDFIFRLTHLNSQPRLTEKLSNSDFSLACMPAHINLQKKKLKDLASGRVVRERRIKVLVAAYIKGNTSTRIRVRKTALA